VLAQQGAVEVLGFPASAAVKRVLQSLLRSGVVSMQVLRNVANGLISESTLADSRAVMWVARSFTWTTVHG
jgi:hypothetical protein